MAPSVAAAQVPSIAVNATVETEPVPNIGDAADDPAIWIHPTDPSLSTIIGTDKTAGGGLGVYDLSGRQLYFYADGRLNNVDVRYNFPLGGSRVSLVGATNRELRQMDFYRVDPAARSLTKVGSVATSSAIVTPRGFSFYVSPVSGKYYAFVSDVGNTDQYELSGASGSVTGTLVRQFTRPNPTEGLVADDELGRIYLAEENVGGLWRYGAEPGDGSTGVLIDSTTETGGTITQDVKGLALYYGANRTGYVIATSQGGSSFHLYNRGDNAKVGVFEVVAGAGVDAVTGIDGIDVTNFGLGSAFRSGLFVTQDHANEGGGNQNFKVVPWQAIANGFISALLVDSTWDPRLIGASAAGVGAVTPPSTGTGFGPSGAVLTVGSTVPAGGASGISPQPPPPSRDVTAPAVKLSGSRLQKLSTISVWVACPDEPCRATTRGRVRVPRVRAARAKTYTLQIVTRSIAQGSTLRARPRLSAVARAAIRRALKAGKQVIVRFELSVADAAGNKQTLDRQIKLKR